MNKLDLHGVRHGEVDRIVENFIFLNQNDLPLTIICGNSERMIELVTYVTRRLGCTTAMTQYGVITIRNV